MFEVYETAAAIVLALFAAPTPTVASAETLSRIAPICLEPPVIGIGRIIQAQIS